MKTFWFAMITGVAVILIGNEVFAASPDPFQQYEMQRQGINRSAMLVLGSWAVGNMLVGTYGHFNTTGQTREFHQFNFMWNVVNLGIAAFGYHQPVFHPSKPCQHPPLSPARIAVCRWCRTWIGVQVLKFLYAFVYFFEYFCASIIKNMKHARHSS